MVSKYHGKPCCVNLAFRHWQNPPLETELSDAQAKSAYFRTAALMVSGESLASSIHRLTCPFGGTGLA